MRVNCDVSKPSTEQVRQKGVEAAEKKPGLVAENTVPAGGSASVSLSGRAQEVNRLSQAAANAPEIGADRVAELREQIKRGEYQVNYEGLAASLIDRTPGADSF